VAAAIFPGTFDPVTAGHLDIIQRSLEIFDDVRVAVATHHDKREMFTIDERVEMMRAVTANLGGITVMPFSGLLVDFAREQGVVTVIRGLRVLSDFESEFQMALMNRKLSDAVETLFFMPSEEHVCLSSTVVKEIAWLGGRVQGLVPELVARRLEERIAAARS
jgi:pantetheine-phosphate adenylyltransferase